MSGEPTEWSIPHFDKILHAGIYAALAISAVVLAAIWGIRLTPIRIAGLFLLLVFAGVFDEVTQGFVEGRTTDPFDLLADSVGALLGFSLCLLFRTSRTLPSSLAE